MQKRQYDQQNSSYKNFWRISLGVIFILMISWSFLMTFPAERVYEFQPVKTGVVPDHVSAQTVNSFSVAPYNHASAMATQGDYLYLTWYAGTAEHQSDVDIMLTVGHWNHHGGIDFSKPKAVMSQKILEKAQNRIRHALGNPILAASKDRLWLFFVSTTGGWATSSINKMYSDDHGKTWSDPQPVITTAMFNYSTLTRGNPVSLTHGRFAIPFYNELLTKSGRYIVFNHEGDVVDVRRMSWNGFTLQPVVVPISSHQAWAFFRRSGNQAHRMYQSYTNDGGKTWQPAKPTTLRNPDSGLSAFLAKKTIGVIYNNAYNDRHNLTLALADRPYQGQWKNVLKMESSPDEKFSYPFTVWFKGHYYVSYSADTNDKIQLVKLVSGKGAA